MLTSKGPIEGEIMNISLGGAFVSCEEQPDYSEKFRMVMRIPHPRQFIRATVRIARSKTYDPNGLYGPIGIGVRFVEISEDDLRYIREVVGGHNSSSN